MIRDWLSSNVLMFNMAVYDSEQVVFGVQLPAPEALVPPDLVLGHSGGWIGGHHHPTSSRTVRQEQKL